MNIQRFLHLYCLFTEQVEQEQESPLNNHKGKNMSPRDNFKMPNFMKIGQVVIKLFKKTSSTDFLEIV